MVKPTRGQLKAMVHPLRWQMLDTLAVTRKMSPAGLARLFDDKKVKVNLVAYHMHELEKEGLVQLVSTAPRRGSTEHFYRAVYRIRVEPANGDVERRVRGDQLVEIQPVKVKMARRKMING